jgi:hypothetical protein
MDVAKVEGVAISVSSYEEIKKVAERNPTIIREESDP